MRFTRVAHVRETTEPQREGRQNLLDSRREAGVVEEVQPFVFVPEHLEAFAELPLGALWAVGHDFA
jgi:hypothetical protein